MHQQPFAVGGTLPVAVRTVDEVLERDPCGVYAMMDEPTRASYRAVVEEWAARTGLEPVTIAERVVEMARTAPPQLGPAAAHVGFHLVGHGAADAARALRPRYRWRARIALGLRTHPLFVYVSLASAASLLLAGAAALYARMSGGTWLQCGLVAIVGMPLYYPVGSLPVRSFLARHLPGRALPRLAYREGIPDESRTLVVVNTMLGSLRDVQEAVAWLERLGQASQDPNLFFALLTDFHDAAEESLPGEEQLLEAAADALRALNDRDGGVRPARFFMLHRARRWNARQGVWMGWERKRGKLGELFALLRTRNAATSYRWQGGGMPALLEAGPFRYVLTLDEETWLGEGQALQLVRTAAHPLNQVVYDDRTGRRRWGYGIFQPLVMMVQGSIPLRPAGTPGGPVQPPALPRGRGARDFYFELSGETVFLGKALLDVDAMHRRLWGVLPENRLLNDDKLDGYYVGTAAVADAELQEPRTTGLLPILSQKHRYYRGDVQWSPWILPWVPHADGRLHRNPVPPAGRAILAVSLLHHSTPWACFCMLQLAWSALPGSAVVWTFVATIKLWVPYVLHLHRVASRRRQSRLTGTPDRVGDRPLLVVARKSATAPMVGLLVIPILSITLMEAVLRTLWRMLVSRRNLLEWTTHRRVVARSSSRTLRGHWQALWPSTAAGIGTLLLVALRRPENLPLAAPFAIVWMSTFYTIWNVERPRARP